MRQRHYGEVLPVESVVQQRGLEEHADEFSVGPFTRALLRGFEELRCTPESRIIGLACFDERQECPGRLHRKPRM